MINRLIGYWSSWEETIFVYIWIYLRYWGLEPIILDRCFLRTYDFWMKLQSQMLLDIHRFMCCLCYSLCLLSRDCFLSVYLPFNFLSYLNVVFNSFRIHMCYALANVSDISQMFLLKLIWNSSCDALYWWTIHVSLLSPRNQWLTVTEWLSCLCWDSMYEALRYLYLFWLHCEMVICVVSTICIT